MSKVKNVLLIFWNAIINTRNKVKSLYFRVYDCFYKRIHKAPQVKSNEETLEYIVKNKCSVSRFGDGEIKLAKGTDISFQKADDFVVKKMRDTLSSDAQGHIVCLADIFSDLSQYEEDVQKHWKKHLSQFRKTWYKYTHNNKAYYNAFISRPYIELKDKSQCGEWFSNVKKIWDGRDIVFIEGEKSRLGVGNDLFDNVKSVRRILGPNINAFSKYDELMNEALKVEKSALILLALGPCATALSLDLHKRGYQAIDIGHIDIEYEWYLSGATKKQPVKNKFVNEARTSDNSFEINDSKYLSEIIAKII